MLIDVTKVSALGDLKHEIYLPADYFIEDEEDDVEDFQ